MENALQLEKLLKRIIKSGRDIRIKLIGTNDSEISKYPLDCYSILHFIYGTFAYLLVFPLINLFIVDWLTTLFGTYLLIMLSGIFWEIIENSILIDMKVFKERDYIINSQTDVVLVFLGGIFGCYIYNLPKLLTVFIIGGMVILFVLAKIFTKIKFKNRKTVQKLT